MKLRLFGCAAACVLAGTLCVSAQDSDLKTKGSASDVGSSTQSKDPSGASQMKETSDNGLSQGADDKGKANRDNRQAGEKESGARENRAGNDGPSLKKGKTDTAVDKSDKDSLKGTSNAVPKDTKGSRERSVAQEGKSKSEPSAASKQDKGTADDKGAKNDQESDRTDKAGKNVQLAGEKRDRVQSSFRSDLKLKRETKVDVSISIGSRAPRTWAFAPVPTKVVELVPEYRGYVVAYVEDEYVICDPDTYEIVALLPASGDDLATTGRSSGESGSDRCSASLSLTESDRRAIFDEIEMGDEIDASGVTIGWSVPSDVELKTFPRTIIDRSGALGSCRYFIVDGQVALVEPNRHEVVLLIDHK